MSRVLRRRYGHSVKGKDYQVGSVLIYQTDKGEERRIHVTYRFGGERPGFQGVVTKPWKGNDHGFDDQIVRVVQLKPTVRIRPYVYHGVRGFLVNDIFVHTMAGADAIKKALQDDPNNHQVIANIIRAEPSASQTKY